MLSDKGYVICIAWTTPWDMKAIEKIPATPNTKKYASSYFEYESKTVIPTHESKAQSVIAIDSKRKHLNLSTTTPDIKIPNIPQLSYVNPIQPI